MIDLHLTEEEVEIIKVSLERFIMDQLGDDHETALASDLLRELRI
jgi:hypothetical protein